MLAKLHSVTLEGIEAIICEVEVDITKGGFEKSVIVGLPDTAVRESSERVRSAVVNSGYSYPRTQILVNLAPADVKKAGPAFDLPIAIGLLAAEGLISTDNLKDAVIAGELALDGRVRGINGALSMAIAAKEKGFSRLFLPLDNAREAGVVEGIDVYGIGSLAQAIGILTGELEAEPVAVDVGEIFNTAKHYDIDFSDVKGQHSVKRALTVAAAGGHNILMIGPPGAGKTMLAQRIATILPDLSLDESLETTKIYSSAGLLESRQALIARRPVRMPHHSSSGPALVGGGTVPRPGELSLAHYGILFLDEFAEFPRHVLEMIRQPLEDGTITVSRAQATVKYPADFMLVAAMNPCPCGYYGSSERNCRCTPGQVERYLSKVSGPLMDRIDIHIEVPAVGFGKLQGGSDGLSSAQIRQVVQSVRAIQSRRFNDGRVMTNSRMSHKQVERFCRLDEGAKALLRSAMSEFGLSGRAHDKVCKVARTIADLEGCESIAAEHIAEAISYRKLDRSL